jgi:hypothetical protein
MIHELDQLVKQLDDVEPKAGGISVDYGGTDTRQTSNCGRDLGEERQQLRANREAEMDRLRRQVEAVYDAAREAD